MDFTATSNVCRGAPVNFNSSFGGCDNIGLSYLWQFQGGDPATSTEANPTGITYSESGDFNVKLIINQSCGEGDTLVKSAYIHINPCVVSQLEAPNVFTPNGDGFNDTYKVKYHDPFEKFYIKIWNRWGTTMYESNDINAGWNCNKCADGTYYYIIEALGKDGKKYDLHGTITVLH